MPDFVLWHYELVPLILLWNKLSVGGNPVSLVGPQLPTGSMSKRESGSTSKNKVTTQSDVRRWENGAEVEKKWQYPLTLSFWYCIRKFLWKVQNYLVVGIWSPFPTILLSTFSTCDVFEVFSEEFFCFNRHQDAALLSQTAVTTLIMRWISHTIHMFDCVIILSCLVRTFLNKKVLYIEKVLYIVL